MKTTLPRAQYLVNAKGKRTGVVLTLKQYEKLLEDLHDLSVAADRRAEKPITLDALKKRLSQNG